MWQVAMSSLILQPLWIISKYCPRILPTPVNNPPFKLSCPMPDPTYHTFNTIKIDYNISFRICIGDGGFCCVRIHSPSMDALRSITWSDMGKQVELVLFKPHDVGSLKRTYQDTV